MVRLFDSLNMRKSVRRSPTRSELCNLHSCFSRSLYLPGFCISETLQPRMLKKLEFACKSRNPVLVASPGLDYKTSRHEGADLEAFLDCKRERYAPQRRAYGGDRARLQ